MSPLPHIHLTQNSSHAGFPAPAEPCRSGFQPPTPGWLKALLSILWLTQAIARAGDIQINELFFHPPSHKNEEEWIELTNTGNAPADLAGWQFTRGIDFKFPPNTRVEPGGFLVIAANLEVFRSLHPEVTTVIGGWKGQLANSGQTLQLEDDTGHTVESIEYSNQGEWAVRVPGPAFRGHTGWEWTSTADGLGASLERIQPQLPGNYGQNWQSSLNTNGTPGSLNSRFATNLPPIILDVAHSPSIPRSNEVVTVTARFLDESTNVLAHLHWRVDGTNDFQSVPLSDAGPPGDRTPGDGRYSAQIPAQAEGTIVEFYVSAEDSSGLRRTWPAPAQVAGAAVQILNALYQVDGSVPNTSKSVGNPPLYRIVLTAADRQELADINRNLGFAAQSHAQFNATFIAEDAEGASLRYTTGVRNRGNGSATRQPQSFRVNFRHDDRWKDVDGLNLNTQYTPAQLFGSALYRKAGLPAALSRPARVRVNASTLSDRGAPTYGFYVANELIDSDYATTRFPNDSNGNVYRGIRGSGRGADLHYEGELPGPYRVNYSKRTNVSQDDWSDLIGLCRVIGDTNAVSAAWFDQLKASMDIEQWMLYFALETIVDNHETNLGNGNNGTGQGDDYFLYFGTLDRRARVIPYDLDTILGVGDSPFNAEDGLFRMNSNPWIARILRQPPVTALYYQTLQRLLDGPCNAVQFDALVDEVLGGLGVEVQMTTMKQFAAARRTALERLIPRSLSVTNTDWPIVNGTLQINAPIIQLGGRANAATTFSVKLNGTNASYSHLDAAWLAPQVSLNPGLNVLSLTAHDAFGQEIERISVRIFRPLDSIQPLPFTITSDQTLQPHLSPFLIPQSLRVESNATLRIEAGVVLYFGTNASLTLEPGSRILVEGTKSQPVLFLPQPGSTEPWSGIVLRGTSNSPPSLFTHVGWEGTRGIGLDVQGGTVLLDHASFHVASGSCIRIQGASFDIRDGFFDSSNPDAPLVSCSEGIPPSGSGTLRRCFFAPVSTSSPQLRLSGGRRSPLEPIIGVFESVFTRTAFNAIELVGADARIEGNLFLDFGGTAIRGIGDGVAASSATVLRNGFLIGTEAIAARDDSDFTILNNTFHRVALSRPDGRGAPAMLSTLGNPVLPLPGSSPGKGFYFGANITSESGPLISPDSAPPESLIAHNNVVSIPWNGQGTNNFVGLPLFRHGIASTQFSVQSWTQAQTIWDQLELADGSPALRRGFNGQDAGAAIPPDSSTPPALPTETKRGIQIHEIQVGRARDGQPAVDALELFNPTESTVFLTGFSLSQSLANPRHYTFPEGSSVPPHGYLIVRAAKNSANPDPYQTGFGLDASGDSIFLFDAQTNQQDQVVFGLQIPGYTIGRVLAARNTPPTDGPNPGWVWTLCEPTLGSENRPLPLGDPTDVRISEWLASPGLLFEEDFVELHNPTPLPIAVGGLFLTDHPTALLPNREPIPVASLSKYVPIGTRLAALSFLPAQGWQQFRSGGALETKADRIGFKLASDTGTLALYTTTDAIGSVNQPWSIVQLIDFITYRAQYPGVSQGRSSGFAGLRYFLNPTPGIANPVTHIPGTNKLQSLVLNEILAHNRNLRDPDGQFPDWVEIYNPNPVPISLAGIQLTDSLEIPGRFVFPPASEIAGFGLVLVRFLAASPVDESDGWAGPSPTPFRATFGLSRNGGSLFLLASKSAGETILDQIHYGILPADLSLGRFPNATGPWVLSQPTPLLLNQPVELGKLSALKINEWMANPSSGDDWFELYNSDPAPIELSGLTLSDDPSNPSKHSIAPYSYIAGHGFIQFHADDQPDQGPHHVRFQLSNKGEFIGLYGTNGAAIDSVTFGPQAEGISEGRLSDGAGEFVRFAAGSTPGGSNWKDSDSDGLPDPWEMAHGSSIEDPGDALLDTDGDGMLNRDEFRASTDPRDASDFLHVDVVKSNAGSLRLEFRAQPGHAYRVQVRDALDTPWRDSEAVVARDLPRRIRIPIAGDAPLQFLRLVLTEP